MYASTLLKYFRGRADHYARQAGSGFEPVKGTVNSAILKSQHLSGDTCLGFYLLTSESKCYCACVDFDNKEHDPNPEWKTQAEALYFYLENSGLCPLVEMSQSGSGCHVWIFFADAVDAWIPRAFLKACGTRLGTAYKEVYPRQEKLASPEKLGNLVRYPGWGKSHFVDVEDDWKHVEELTALESTRRIITPGGTLLELAAELGLGVLEPEVAATQMIATDSGNIKLPARVHRLVSREHTLLGKRWANNTAGMTDPSPSAVAMSVAAGLVKAYVPESEVVAALNIWVKVNAPDKADRPDWIKHTVVKAYEMVYSRMNKVAVKATTLAHATEEAIQQIELGGEIVYPAGVEAIDRSIEGICQGEVAVIAAWPSHGKTALGLQWACNIAATQAPVLILSEEMSARKLARRRLLRTSEIASQYWNPEYATHLRKLAQEEQKDWHDTYIAKAESVDKACELITQYVRIHGVQLVMIDYIQLLNVEGSSGNSYQDVTKASKMIKHCATANEVAIISLAQMNNASMTRMNNNGGRFEPQLNDIKESGQIGQDADLVMFACYPYKWGKSQDKNQYIVYVDKRRDGDIVDKWLSLRYDTSRQIIF